MGEKNKKSVFQSLVSMTDGVKETMAEAKRVEQELKRKHEEDRQRKIEENKKTEAEEKKRKSQAKVEMQMKQLRGKEKAAKNQIEKLNGTAKLYRNRRQALELNTENQITD